MLAPQWEIPSSDVQINSEAFAEGGSASVFKGLWMGNLVAVKLLHFKVDRDIIDEMQAELSIAFPLRHPNVIQVFGASIDGSNPLLILEYADGGSLNSFLRNYSRKLESTIVNRFFSEIVKGMEYLHHQNPPVIHGDLKAANVLITNLNFGINATHLKITDFGLSKVKSIVSSKQLSSNSVTGTLRWISPGM
ncbi:hypothetical protein HK096_009437 [Nowakowskiella sp. JEL0078]|nr:hypothetical protein HK096_009437 [Nowakowskiella sp. JEL0078]